MRISDWSSDVCSSDLLDSLGALTRGQRQTGGQNLFDPADNLESDYAREALTQWYHLLHGNKLSSVNMESFQAMTGLKLRDEDGTLLEKLPPIQRWLNRILALRIATQNARSEEHTSELQSLMRISYAVSRLKKKNTNNKQNKLNNKKA